MLTAFILVCAVNAPCNYNSAASVYAVPPKSAMDGMPDVGMNNPAMCSLKSQQWAALHIKAGDGYFIKTFCVPPNKLPGNVG